MSQHSSIVVRSGVGDVFAMIAAEGNGYSPDLVHDMVQRSRELFRDTLKDAIECGYIQQPSDEEEEEEEFIDDDGEYEEVTDVRKRFWQWLQ